VDVLNAIQRQAGAHFDPRVVTSFMQLPHPELL
jgi:response regulator RpfG family c-di-GMP phosphodiesterase